MDIVNFDDRFIQLNTTTTLQDLPILDIFQGKSAIIYVQFRRKILGTPYAAEYNYLDGPDRARGFYIATFDSSFWHQVETATYISFD